MDNRIAGLFGVKRKGNLLILHIHLENREKIDLTLNAQALRKLNTLLRSN